MFQLKGSENLVHRKSALGAFTIPEVWNASVAHCVQIFTDDPYRWNDHAVADGAVKALYVSVAARADKNMND